jgi:hypothetical protein
MQTITRSDLEAVTGGKGPAGDSLPSAQDILNAKPADNRVLSEPNNGGFQTNTPMVATPDSNANIPDSVFSALGR